MNSRTRNIIFAAVSLGLIGCICAALAGTIVGVAAIPPATTRVVPTSAPLPTTIGPAPTTPPTVITATPPPVVITATSTVAPPPPTTTPSTAACVPNTMPDGTVITAQVLANQIGGKAEFWTPRSDAARANCLGGVWGYWDKDHSVQFKHPGGNTMLTYWSGFKEPTGNIRGCWIQVPVKNDRWDGTTRTVQCPDSGALINADGVGFHPVAPSN